MFYGNTLQQVRDLLPFLFAPKCIKENGSTAMESFGVKRKISVKKCGINDPPKTPKPDFIPPGQGEPREKRICPHCSKEF